MTGLFDRQHAILGEAVHREGARASHFRPCAPSRAKAGTLGGLLTTWVTFIPCFLWIFAGAPFIERLRENRALAGALAAITAAVVGVILNLAVWFALHYWFGRIADRRAGPLTLPVPDLGTIDWFAVLFSLAALAAMVRFRFGTFSILGICSLAGLVRVLVA